MDRCHDRQVATPVKLKDTAMVSTTTQPRLASYRERRDHFFAHDDGTPLEPEQLEQFQGLAYFPENPALAMELPLKVDGDGIGQQIDLATADGYTKPFVRVGRISFTYSGEPVILSVFKDLQRGRYFLPFRDGSAGRETYAVGRYLDPRTRPDGTLVVDFNYAYNPYCAYSQGWSCPIPPFENVIGTSLEAGEKAFPKS